MNIFGVKLRQPVLSDLPMVLYILLFGSVLVGVVMLGFGWDIGRASAIIYGYVAAAIATACGVDFRKVGFRGFLVVVLIMIALVVSTAGLFLILK